MEVYNFESFYKIDNRNSEIHFIKEKNVHDMDQVFVTKVYEKEDKYYQNEKNILTALNDYLICYPDLEGGKYILKLKEFTGKIDFEKTSKYKTFYYLPFDYLNNGSLFSYFFFEPPYFDENIVKLLCIKLLKGLKVCHSKNICHRRIEPKHIMFDKDYNPVIIGFTRSLLMEENNQITLDQDFIDLAQLIIKMLSGGVLQSIIRDQNGKITFKQNNRTINEKRLWDSIFLKRGSKIQYSFQKFFSNLLSVKVNVDDLLKEGWLNLDKDIKEIENSFKIEIENRKEKIEKKKIIDTNSMKINLDDLLEKKQNFFSFFPINYDNDNTRGGKKTMPFNELKIKKINHKHIGFMPEYYEIKIINNKIIDKNINDKLPYSFFNDLFEQVKLKYGESNIQPSEDYLEFILYFEDSIENNENDDEEGNNEDRIEDDEELEKLSIKVELYQYENVYDFNNCSYYLYLNHISGDEFEYYQKIKEIIDIVKKTIKENYS